MGQTYAATGRVADAIRAYGGALAEQFRLDWAQELIGLDPAGAARELADLAPAAGAPAWLALGMAYSTLEQRDAAAAAFVQALTAPLPQRTVDPLGVQRDSDLPEPVDQLLGMADTVAQFLLDLGPEQAIPHLEQVAGTPQATAFTWSTLASAYTAADRPDDAMRALSRALELEPENPAALQQLVATSPSVAEGIVLGSERLRQDDELWGDLGDAYREREQRDEARRCYQRARSLDPEDSEWVQSLTTLGS